MTNVENKPDPAFDSRRFQRLLRPRSIAAIGGKEAAEVVRQTLKMGFNGEIWPVHPRKETVEGLRGYPSIAQLPRAPDACFLGVNRDRSIDAVAALDAIGSGGVVSYASGFAETDDGEDRQAALVNAAGTMPILGPNCYGLINYLDGALLWPDQHGGRRSARGPAILTQSSNIAINLTMQARGLPISYVICAGNQAQMELSDMAHALLDDERVTAIGLHIEGLKTLAPFENLARRARDTGVPIVALKVGRSEQAQAAAISHTASLAGSSKAFSALLKRLGVGEVTSLSALLECLKLLHVHGPLSGREICSLSCSGGEAGLMADAVVGRRLTYPALKPSTAKAVSQALPEMVVPSNPLDYHTFVWGDEERMTNGFKAMLSQPYDAAILVCDIPRPDRCSDEAWLPTMNAWKRASTSANSKALVLTSLVETCSEDWADRLMADGIAPMQGLDDCMSALEVSADIGEAWGGDHAANVGATPLIDGVGKLLDEAGGKALLSEHGLDVPLGIVTSDLDDAEAFVHDLDGKPVVLKGLGAAHKTEANLVALDIATSEQLRDAWQGMADRTDLFLVEEMIEGAIAELIVGVTRDALVGPVLTLGAGGQLVELLQDSATVLLPTNANDIEQALKGLRIWPLLAGYRGRVGADLPTLVSSIRAIADFVIANAHRLEELDINPLIVTPSRIVAADVLLKMKEPENDG